MSRQSDKNKEKKLIITVSDKGTRDRSRRAGAMVEHLPLGHTAEVRAQKMRALRAEAGKQAKAGLDAIRERCAPATAFPAVSERHRFPPIRLLLSTARAL